MVTARLRARRGRPLGALEQTGVLLASTLEGFRKTWDVRRWGAEFVEQCARRRTDRRVRPVQPADR